MPSAAAPGIDSCNRWGERACADALAELLPLVHLDNVDAADLLTRLLSQLTAALAIRIAEGAQLDKRFAELSEPGGPHRALPVPLDALDRASDGPNRLLTAIRQVDQARPAVIGVGPALQVAPALQFPHQITHGLPAQPSPLCERGKAHASGCRMLEHGQVSRADVAEPRALEVAQDPRAHVLPAGAQECTDQRGLVPGS